MTCNWLNTVIVYDHCPICAKTYDHSHPYDEAKHLLWRPVTFAPMKPLME